MSGTFPTGNVRAVNFKDNAPNLVTTSLSGRRQTKSQGQQYFSFTIQTPPLTSTDLKPILGFISKQRGQFESFQVQLPNISTPAGSITSNTLAVNAPSNLDAGVKSIPVDGGTASASGYLKAGDIPKRFDYFLPKRMFVHRIQEMGMLCHHRYNLRCTGLGIGYWFGFHYHHCWLASPPYRLRDCLHCESSTL